MFNDYEFFVTGKFYMYKQRVKSVLGCEFLLANFDKIRYSKSVY